jgi:C_GCAxxG_C_C family probable redox protein
VLLAVSKATGQTCDCIPNIAIGLEGGLSAGEVCGAVSGGVLALGLLYGDQEPEAVTYLTEEFVKGFEERHGALRCEDLIGFNFSSMNSNVSLGSLKGVLKFGMRGGKRVCNGFVSSAVEVLLDQLEDWES